MSEGQTWNSEDTRLYSFTVFFGPWQAVVMGAGYMKQSTDVCWPVRGSNPLASLWKVCSSLLAATATVEFALKSIRRWLAPRLRQARVESVAQRIAEEIEAHQGKENEKPGKKNLQRRNENIRRRVGE
jgi:hypothetical protein